MNKDDLLSLRQDIVASTNTAALDGDAPAEVRLPIVLELARGTDDVNLLRKAYDLAKEIQDKDAQLNALLDVLAEVDSKVARLDVDSPAEDTSSTGGA